MSNKSSNRKESYSFNPKLKQYLDECHRLEEIKEAKKESNLGSHEKRDIRNNDEMKVRALDRYVFGSMANLIYFFEYLAKNPEIRYKFDDDIQELFGIKGEHWKSDGKAKDRERYSALYRLIMAILEYKVDITKSAVLSIIGRNTLQKLIIEGGENEPLIGNRIINQDLGRALTWIQFITLKSRTLNVKPAHRLISF